MEPTKHRSTNIKKLNKWLIVEAIVLMSTPVLLLLYAMPMLLLVAAWSIFPMEGDTDNFIERALRWVPYVGYIFALWVVWRAAYSLAIGRVFPLDWKFFVAAIFGGLASWEIFTTTNSLTTLLVCVPPWVLVIHLLYLRKTHEVR